MRLSIRQFSDVVTHFQMREAAAGGSEKRSVTRISIHAPIEVNIYDGSFGKPFTALCRDISLEGVGLMTGVAFQAGQKLVVKLPGSHDPPLHVLAAVMHCRTMADGIFVLGCRFSRVLDADEAKSLDDQGQAQIRKAQQSILS